MIGEILRRMARVVKEENMEQPQDVVGPGAGERGDLQIRDRAEDLREGPDAATPLPAETENGVSEGANDVAQIDQNVATQDVVLAVCPKCGTAGEVCPADVISCETCGLDFCPPAAAPEVREGVLGADQPRGHMCEPINE